MKRAQPEAAIQKAVVAQIKARGAKGMVWFHVPNSSKLGGKKVNGIPLEAIRGKALGVRSGVSDFIFLKNGEAFALELKAPGGRPTETQLQFISEFNEAGGYAVCAEGLNEAIRILETWNLLNGSTQ